MKWIVLFALLAIICTVSAKNCKQVCTPKEIFMIKCNRCVCSADGLSFACTKRFCPRPPIGPPRRCIPGSSFKVDCNTCVCNPDGTIGACTLMACAPVKAYSR